MVSGGGGPIGLELEIFFGYVLVSILEANEVSVDGSLVGLALGDIDGTKYGKRKGYYGEVLGKKLGSSEKERLVGDE